MKKTTQEQIVNYLKNYGFVYPSLEIYGGIANTWDYGPLGTLLKQNIKQLWWKTFVTSTPNTVGLDSAIIGSEAVWKASKHLENFNDPLIDCKECHNRFRADKLIEERVKNVNVSEQTSFEELEKLITKHKIVCPVCGKSSWTPIRRFNLMYKVQHGVIEGKNVAYLRPETAQGIFTNFLNVQRTQRLKLPFAIAQIGKSFRNEITPGNFIFRTTEFEQMELEYFVYPKDDNKIFHELLEKVETFLYDTIGLDKSNVRLYEHKKDELSHYSKKTIDIQYKYPHGWSELWGIANRGDYDLSTHIEHSKANLYYLDQTTNQKIVPFVIEPSVGVERLLYALVLDKYEVQKLPNDEEREVLHLNYELAPYKVAVLPLVNKLNEQTYKIFQKLLNHGISATFDTSGSIGKRYRRQDAIGTPYCVTFDFDSLKDESITIRERDSMQQQRIKISEITNFLLHRK